MRAGKERAHVKSAIGAALTLLNIADITQKTKS